MKKTIDVETFIQMLSDTKLTPPQQKIYDRLKNGERLGINNPHHQSGGDIVWVDAEGTPRYAGRIYRALNTMLWMVERRMEKETALQTPVYLTVKGLYVAKFKGPKI